MARFLSLLLVLLLLVTACGGGGGGKKSPPVGPTSPGTPTSPGQSPVPPVVPSGPGGSSGGESTGQVPGDASGGGGDGTGGTGAGGAGSAGPGGTGVSVPAGISGLPEEPPNPGTFLVTETSGFITGWVVDAATNGRLEGATITVDGVPGSAPSDADGNFAVPLTPDNNLEKFAITLRKEGYTTAYREAYLRSGRAVTVEEVRLAPLDPAVTTIGPAGGTHTNSGGTVEVVIPPGVFSSDKPVGVTQYQRGEDLGGVLPETSYFTYAIELSPDGTTFSQPATVRMKNTRSFPPGTEIPVGYYNASTRQWEHEGMATVDPSGEWAIFTVTHFSPWDINFPVKLPDGAGNPHAAEDFTEQTQGIEEKDCGNSAVGLSTGNLTVDRPLPSHRSFNREQNLRFVYQSERADPQVLVSFEKGLREGDTVPQQIGFKATFQGQVQEKVFEGSDQRILLQALYPAMNSRGEALSTGLYDYQAELTHYYPAEYATADRFGGPPIRTLGIAPDEPGQLASRHEGKMVVVNQQDSPFGSGWGLAGTKRLYPQSDGKTVLLVDGSGVAVPFNAGEFSLVAGTGNFGYSGDDGPATGAEINSPSGLAFDGQGNLFVADMNNHVVRKIDRNGIITTIAGTGVPGYSGDGGPALNAQLNLPEALAISPNGEIYVGEAMNHVVRRIDRNGIISTVAGTGESGYTGDGGPAVSARLAIPNGLAFDRNGNLYIADGANHVVRKVTPDGLITTFAGTGEWWRQPYGFAGDRGPATGAALNRPWGIDVDDEGNVYIGDMNSVIRKVDLNGTITTIAGIGASGFNGDNRRALDTAFMGISGLNVLSDGTIYVSDLGNNRVRKISPDGIVTTIAGNGQATGSGGSGPASFRAVNQPTGLVVDANGILHVSARGGDQILKMGEKVFYAPAGVFSSLTKNDDETYTLTHKDQSRELFNEEGFLVRQTDRDGHETRYSYDDNRRLEKITDPFGGETSFSYNGEGRLEGVTDPQGRVTQFGIGASGDLLSMTLPDGSVWRYAYENHRMVSRTDPRGFATSYAYNALGKIEKVVAPTGEERSYDTGWGKGVIGNMAGGTMDAPAQVVPATENITRFTDGRGNVTTYQFNQRGHVVSVTDPLGNVTTYQRNDRSQTTGLTTPAGITQAFEYDANGNLIRQDWDANRTGSTVKTYDEKDQLIRVNLEDIHKDLLFSYDDEGHLTSFTDVEESVTRWAYNEDGLVETLTNAAGEITTFIYDDRGNLESVQDGLGNTTGYTRDGAGNLSRVTDANGNATTHTRDPLNRLTSVTDTRGGTTTFAYGQVGCGCGGSYDRVTSVTDANGNVTTFDYDGLGEMTSVTDPLGRTETRSYDLARNLVGKTDRNGAVTTFEYDAINRLTRVVRPEGATTYSYDAVGNLLTASNPDETLSFTYDYLPWNGRYRVGTTGTSGLVESSITTRDSSPTSALFIDDLLGTTNIGRNNRGESTYLSYPDRASNLMPALFWTQRDALGRLTRVNVGSQLEKVFTYDTAGRLTHIKYDSGSGTQDDQDHDFTLDGVGNLITETGPSETHTYGYDATYQVLSDSHSGARLSYDPLGNWLTAFSFIYVPGTGNRLTSVGTNVGTTRTYRYDNNGNLTSKTHGSVTSTYTWNSQNQLGGATNSLGLTASFKYDPFGRRIEKNINGTVRRYVYLGDQIRFVYDGDNNLLYSFMYGPGIDFSIRVVDHSTGESYAYLQDGRGSVYQIQQERAGWLDGHFTYPVVRSYGYNLFGSTGEVTNTRYEYDEGGNITAAGPSDLDHTFAYTGREWEPQLGLYYYRNRWYDPMLGRFLSEDPIGFAGGDVNLYRYVFNNPVNLIDPWGLDAGDVYLYESNNFIQSIVGGLTSGGSFGHAGIELPNGDILTARPGQGVTIDSKGSLAGKHVSIIRPIGKVDSDALYQFASQTVGAGYDYFALVSLGSSGKFTCGEVVAGASVASGNALQGLGSYITPNSIANSPTFNQSVQFVP